MVDSGPSPPTRPTLAIGDQLPTAAAAPPAGRLIREIEIDRPPGDEHVTDPGTVEEAALGDNHVGHLPLLNRAEPIAGPREPGRVHRERLDGGVLSQSAVAD